jgi:hypothetical protein
MRERAETIGARLSVQSELGEGTVVTVIWLDPECEPAAWSGEGRTALPKAKVEE